MTKILLIVFLGVAGAAMAPREIVAQDKCQQCEEEGEYHWFLVEPPNLCNLPNPPQNCYDCHWTIPSGHPGCHELEKEGLCGDHPDCGTEDEEQELLVAIAESDASAISALIGGMEGRAFVNYDRSAIQVRCGEHIVAHLLLPSALLPGLRKALDAKDLQDN